jgi:hypothetical protein
MELIVESPWPAIIVGVLLLMLLGVAYINTRRRGLVTAAGCVLAGVLLLVLMEMFVVTEREEVEQTLEELAVALETNDIDAVVAHLAPNAMAIRAAAMTYLPMVRVSDANVGNDLQVTINRLTSPPTARAEFTGRLSFDKQSGPDAVPYNNFVQKFSLKLEKRDERWLLSSYETSRPGQGGEPLAP